MAEQSKLVASNRMTATQLVKLNGPLDFVKNPHTGITFFVCGNIRGYVSPAVQAKVDTVELEDLQFAMVSKDGAEPIPCLMLVGDSRKNVRRTLSL